MLYFIVVLQTVPHANLVVTFFTSDQIKMGPPNQHFTVVCLFKFWPGSPAPQSIKAASNSVMRKTTVLASISTTQLKI